MQPRSIKFQAATWTELQAHAKSITKRTGLNITAADLVRLACRRLLADIEAGQPIEFLLKEEDKDDAGFTPIRGPT
jgi:hypothetical protein